VRAPRRVDRCRDDIGSVTLYDGTSNVGQWLAFVPPPSTQRALPAYTKVNTLDEQREIYFSGRVQGVGFRFTARAIASRYPVRGFVKNLSDGRVLLVVEGSPKDLDGMVRAIEDEMDRYIDRKDVTIGPATYEFADFAVRR
jgi:acylphosphatase